MDQIRWNISTIRLETADCFTLVLQNTTGEPVAYQSGQFLSFLFDHGGHEIRRSYSFSSSPAFDSEIAITVKRIPNGEISRLLTDRLKPGDSLVSLPPAGLFTYNSNDQNQLVFIAGGSGIIPIFSILKSILPRSENTQLLLISQDHNEESVLFDSKLALLENDYSGRFRRISLLSNPNEYRIPPRKLNNQLLNRLLKDNLNAGPPPVFYLCGPTGLMRMTQITLHWMGFKDSQIKKEFFTIEKPPLPSSLAALKPQSVLIKHKGQTYSFATAERQSILDAAIQHQVSLPYSCRSGRCSNCLVHLRKGRVWMSNNEVLTEADIENGLVLTCTGYALTNLELEW
jgi:ring-1,2-phenylacetyl-CoA epoxidase subunit PaaE